MDRSLNLQLEVNQPETEHRESKGEQVKKRDRNYNQTRSIFQAGEKTPEQSKTLDALKTNDHLPHQSLEGNFSKFINKDLNIHENKSMPNLKRVPDYRPTPKMLHVAGVPSITKSIIDIDQSEDNRGLFDGLRI